MIKIARDFSRTPGARYEKESKYSGESFRNSIMHQLCMAVDSRTDLVIDLDGTNGYGSAFLEEAFGGLVRKDKFDITVLREHLHFISKEEPYLIDDIWNFIEEANHE